MIPHKSAGKNVYNDVDNVDKYLKAAETRRSRRVINCL